MTTLQQAPAELLTVAEAAERLRVSRPTLYRLISRGDMPALRVGGQIRLDAQELERWLYGDPVGEP